MSQAALWAGLESVKLPGVKETAEEASTRVHKSVPNGTEEGLTEGAVAPLPSSAARPGARLALACDQTGDQN